MNKKLTCLYAALELLVLALNEEVKNVRIWYHTNELAEYYSEISNIETNLVYENGKYFLHEPEKI